jgi:hypothetical protein
VLLFENFAEVVGDSLIKIFTTKMRITRGGNNFKDTTIDSKK